MKTRPITYFSKVLPAMAFLCAEALFSSDGRIPVYEPMTISSPGSYYLTRDLSGSSSVTAVITIAAPAVTLDLAGHFIEVAPSATGINVQGVGDIHIRNGMILDGMYGVYATSWGVIHLEGLLFSSQSTQAVTIDRSAEGVNPTPIVEHCTFVDCTAPILLSWCRGGRILGNEFIGSNGRAIAVDRSNGITILQNSCTGSTQGACIYIGISAGNTIAQNHMSNFNGEFEGGGIRCMGGTNNTITDNTAEAGYTAACDGFKFETGCRFNRIRGNTASALNRGFVFDATSDTNVVEDNNSIENLSDGFLVSSGYQILERNTALANSGHGFEITSIDNIVSHNRSKNNFQGNWSISCTTNICVEFSSGYPTNIVGP